LGGKKIRKTGPIRGKGGTMAAKERSTEKIRCRNNERSGKISVKGRGKYWCGGVLTVKTRVSEAREGKSEKK